MKIAALVLMMTFSITSFANTCPDAQEVSQIENENADIRLKLEILKSQSRALSEVFEEYYNEENYDEARRVNSELHTLDLQMIVLHNQLLKNAGRLICE